MKTNKITSEQMKLAINVNSNFNFSPSANKISGGIMNATGFDLVEILKIFCQGLDDYMQLAGDAGDEDIANEFSESYSIIENYWIKAKAQKIFSNSDRTEIRLEMKCCSKQASFYYC